MKQSKLYCAKCNDELSMGRVLGKGKKAQVVCLKCYKEAKNGDSK